MAHTKEQILKIIEAAAAKQDIPKDDFLRFAALETGFKFNERAHNLGSDAKGLFQFTPDTARAYGISGREYDPSANSDAGARLYRDNKASMAKDHAETGRPFLSKANSPNGFDLYIAHQQGATGYASIQEALDPNAGHFMAGVHTRRNILNNIATEDVERFSGVKPSQLRNLSDQDLARTFVKYWQQKYNDVSIPERGVEPINRSHAVVPNDQSQIADPAASGYYQNVIAAVQKAVSEGLKLAEGVSVNDVASRMIVDASNQRLGMLDFSKADSVSVNVCKDGTVGALTQGGVTIAITPFASVSPGEESKNIGQIDKVPSVPNFVASATPAKEPSLSSFG